MWIVWFDEWTRVIVAGTTADNARLRAQFQALDVTTKWLQPIKVEPYS